MSRHDFCPSYKNTSPSRERCSRHAPFLQSNCRKSRLPLAWNTDSIPGAFRGAVHQKARAPMIGELMIGAGAVTASGFTYARRQRVRLYRELEGRLARLSGTQVPDLRAIWQ